MTKKWTVNGVEAPEGAEFYANGQFRMAKNNTEFLWSVSKEAWIESAFMCGESKSLSDYQERTRKSVEAGERIEIIATNGSDGEHYSDYAFCLSEAINKLKRCADVAPDDKRKNALLEIVDEVEFIKSEGDK